MEIEDFIRDYICDADRGSESTRDILSEPCHAV